MESVPKWHYMYVYVLTLSNDIHIYVTKDKYYYTFYLGIKDITGTTQHTTIYDTSVAVINTRVYTRYLQLGMRKYSNIYSYLDYSPIFPMYDEVFECCDIEKFCRDLELTIRLRKQKRKCSSKFKGAYVLPPYKCFIAKYNINITAPKYLK